MTVHVGVTGQEGFIGYHLLQYLRLEKDRYEIIPFSRPYFEDKVQLEAFVRSCDVIVHLAAMNRGDEHEIYQTNVRLIQKLIEACVAASVTPQIIFSSSTQEERDNPYGRSKKAGADLLHAWADKNNAVFTHLVIPNVFGPFGRPYYNSVIATFCHQLTHGEEPKIVVDAALNLIYVQDLAAAIIAEFGAKTSALVHPEPVTEISVSELLKKLRMHQSWYFMQGMIPCLETPFDVALFNTFRSFCVEILPIYPELHTDPRGAFVEVVREMTGGQTSFSTTVPSITRGNHYHLRKIERFCVVKGEAVIRLRRVGTKDILEYRVSGDKPAYIDMPIYYTHNITNVGQDDLLTLFWINEFFDSENPDTYFEEV